MTKKQEITNWLVEAIKDDSYKLLWNKYYKKREELEHWFENEITAASELMARKHIETIKELLTESKK